MQNVLLPSQAVALPPHQVDIGDRFFKLSGKTARLRKRELPIKTNPKGNIRPSLTELAMMRIPTTPGIITVSRWLYLRSLRHPSCF
ncbi:hypothetical protein Godav_002965, partial [Gossypium davidsonii]|nr:hypothetical protein [Gossypium davidsonii]